MSNAAARRTLEAIPSSAHLAAAVGHALPSPALRAIAHAAAGLPATPADLDAWSRITQCTWPSTPPRELALAIGRRGLKTTLASLLLVRSSIDPRHDDDAPRGARLHFLGVAPRLTQSRELLHACISWLERLAPLGVAFEARAVTSDSPEVEIFGPFGTRRLLTIRAAAEINTRGLAVPAAVLDEAAFFGDDGTLRDGAAIVMALRGSQAQFRHRLVVHASSKGPPSGYFHALVESPPAGVVVVTASSWVTNPQITRATCLELSAGDEVAFASEFESSRWSWGGERWISQAAIELLPTVPRGEPVPGAAYAIGLDYAPSGDGTRIVVASTRRDPQGRLHVVVEHVTALQGSRLFPLSARRVATAAADLSARWNNAPVTSDNYSAADLGEVLRDRGVHFLVAPMHPAAQTARFSSLKNLVIEARLGLPDDDGGIRLEIGSLIATQLASGQLRIQAAGRQHDDAADALALAVESALRLMPIQTEGALEVEKEIVGSINHPEGVRMQRRWFRVVGGKRVAAEPPPGTLEFERNVERYLCGLGAGPLAAAEGDRRRREGTNRTT